MYKLSEKDLKLLKNNKIIIHEDYFNYDFTFYYVYQGDSQEAIFLNDEFLMYLDLDEYIDKIKSRNDEKRIITKLLKEELEDNPFIISELID